MHRFGQDFHCRYWCACHFRFHGQDAFPLGVFVFFDEVRTFGSKLGETFGGTLQFQISSTLPLERQVPRLQRTHRLEYAVLAALVRMHMLQHPRVFISSKI